MPYQVFVNGRETPVFQRPCRAYDIKDGEGKIYKHIADSPSFVILTGRGETAFSVVPKKAFQTVKIRPLSAHVPYQIKDGAVHFTLREARNVSVEFDGDVLEPLFIFYSEKTQVPANCAHYFGPGEHEAGRIELKSGESVYLDAGAVVYGFIHAENAENFQILGEGVLSGERVHRKPVTQTEGRTLLDIRDCRNFSIGRLTLYDGQGWHCRLMNTEYAVVDGLRILSMNPSGDGVDVCNSRHARVKNCFLRTNDDCITLKALQRGDSQPMYDIVSENCVCWSATHGNGLEVGYETCTSEMYDIHFRNCDIIHCEHEGYQSGGTLTIHNGDRADIHDVYYEDIRIEDSREKIFDLKICDSYWSHDPIRGKIRDIHFKNIAIVDGPFPPSIIKGFETTSSEFKVKHTEDGTLWVLRDLHDEGTLRDITIENFTVNGEKKTNFMDAKCLIEIATNVAFK